MNKKLMVLVALSSRAVEITTPAVPSRVKMLMEDVRRWRGCACTVEDVLFLLKSVRAFDKTSERFNDLLEAVRVSEAAGYPCSVSAERLSKCRDVASTVPARPDKYTGSTIGVMQDAERREVMQFLDWR